MNKTIKTYGFILLIVMIFVVLLQLTKKEVTNWNKNYNVSAKSPFGLYIFGQEAENFLGGQLQKTEYSPFAYYREHPNPKPQNILIVQKNIDRVSWKKLLNEVSKGSDAMIISNYIPEFIGDSLRFYPMTVAYEEQQTLKFTDTDFQKDSLYLDKFPDGFGFSHLNPTIEILGKVTENENKDQANFIRMKLGEGNIYMHSEPIFLTNYYLLNGKNSRKYLENVFSYLPKRETLWFVDTINQDAPQSMLSFVLSKSALRYAWWTLLAGLLLFAIFNAKRRQRKIPVIEPLQNKSVEFVKSIGNLYLQEGDFHDMMAKKAQYFLHKVRMDLLIDTQNLDDNFAKKLYVKTGKSLDKINEAIQYIKKAQGRYDNVLISDLTEMNKLLDEILR